MFQQILMSVQTGKTIVTLMLIVQTHLGHLNVHATVVSLEMGRPVEVILPYMLRCIRGCSCQHNASDKVILFLIPHSLITKYTV